MTPPKTKCTFDAILHFVAGFLVTRQKLLYLMHYCVEKQVFSWRAKKVQICCIIMWKSRFSHDAPKRFSFVALLRGKAGFLMMRQKGAHLMHYYVEKQFFSCTPKKSYIWCINTWKSRFSHDATENNVYIWCIITFRSKFSHDAPKNYYLIHYYLEKQFFSWRAKNSYIWCINTWKSRFSRDAPKYAYIWCINTWKSRFSHDAPKRFSFVALLRGKAGFLMTRQKGAHLMQYYVEKQFFSWRTKKSYIWCINTWKSRFYHDTPKTLIFDALIRGKAGFLMTPPKTKCTFDAILHFVAGFLVTRQKLLYLMHYCVEKQVFSWRAKKVQICCNMMWKSRFSHDAPKRCNFVALLHGKAGFLITHQKGAHCCIITWKSMISHDATENKVYISFRNRFSHDAPKLLYLMHITWQSRFSHDAPKTLIFDAFIHGKVGFLMTWPKTKCTFDALLRGKAGFIMTRQKLLYLMH